MNTKRLYTPGPLTTSETVKAAMLCDVGSRDIEFTSVVRGVRESLVELVASSGTGDYSAVLLPGSGTYAIEATIGTVVPPDGRLLVVINGAYGERIRAIAARLGVPHDCLRVPEDETVGPEVLEAALTAGDGITHVAVVHCETTTGILNPAAALAAIARAHGLTLVVDGMSSVGALPIDMPAQSLDRDDQFRFTPPTHVVLALAQALDELEAEGGVPERGARYGRNQRRLVEVMGAVGFRPYLPPEVQGPLMTTFHEPPTPFEFDTFYAGLHARGFVIDPGEVTVADTFRVGSIGRLFPADMEALAAAAQEVLRAMGIRLQAA
jgi:2-aminoethylphosphonate-pyruvate transaminase